METPVARAAANVFRAPKRTLGDLDAEVAARLIAAAADIALVVDSKGIIRDVAFGNSDLAAEGLDAWVGQRWIDTVTIESRPKIEELLNAGLSGPAARGRQVNHPSPRGIDIPVRYSVVDTGRNGKIVAVGRDLRTIANLQQRLVEAQQSMEREYARLRHAETRYRLLFQIAAEPVLIVDASTQKIAEANPAAGQLLGKNARKIVGRSFPELFEQPGAKAITAHLAAVRSAGHAEDVKCKLAEGGEEFVVSASLFRQESAAHFLVRLSPLKADGQGLNVPPTRSKVFNVVENLPDGFIVTDIDRRVLTANAAFLDLIQVPTEEQARGETLDRWLGRPGIDLSVLMTNLREYGSIRNYSTIVRGEYGSTEEVEVSAVSVLNGEQPCFGFTVRNTGLKSITPARSGRQLPRSVDQLTKLVGRVALKDLVRETSDVIERLCIEAALELSGDNRASAAEMLGLSRQSLYSKLRRYGLGDLSPDDED